jgi:L-tartrate/succinate antiporter
MYTALSSTCITSSMFLTGHASNLLAISLIPKSSGVTISWIDWFKGFAPIGILLFSLVPFLLYKIYPPQILESPNASRWAGDELLKMGPASRQEITMLLLAFGALALWIGAAERLEAAIAALVIILLMVFLRVVSWDEILRHTQAWNILVWFATLVTLAGGLAQTKFVDWVGRAITPVVSHLGATLATTLLVGAFFFLHYLFASATAHTSALLPVFLAIAAQVPGLSPRAGALLLAYSLGLMGILTPYGGGAAPRNDGRGDLRSRDFWLLGLILGFVFFLVYVAIVIPWIAFLGF